jgi:hypothetical protein
MSGGANDWFVFVDSGDHVGPVTIDLLARGLAAGKVPKDAQVARGSAAEWRPVLTFPELVAAMDDANTRDPDALPPLVPDAPVTEPEMTEVIKRDDEMAKAFGNLDKKRLSSGPPKPPLAPRVSHPDLGPRTGSGAPSAPRVPSVPPTPPPPPLTTPLSLNASPAPPPTGLPQIAAPPAAANFALSSFGSAPPPPPPPPNVLPQIAPQTPFGSAPPPPPPPMGAPQSNAPPANASALSAAPPVGGEPKKDEKKAPIVDPKLQLLVPLGLFAVFVFLSLLVALYALITKSYQ